MKREHISRWCIDIPRTLNLVLGLLLALGASVAAFAQGGASGGVTGRVKDPNGAGVSGAQVEIISQETGVTERTVTTNSEGGFSITLLPIGSYRVVVTANGFSKTEAVNVRVKVTETTNVAIDLKIGGVAETITVSDASTPVQVNTATTGQSLGSNTVGALPLATRNFLTLLTLSTGANTELFQSDALGRGAVTINVNGQRPSNNNYQLEGINANDINLPVLENVPLPNPQTVQEFKTQTSLYDASSGRNGGGNIQVALKSGTNKYHGDAFEFFRNNVLNANDFFNNRAGVTRPTLRQNQFGGSFGGPVPVFKEFFFFANYQGTRAASGAAANTNFTTQIPILPADRSEANLTRVFFPNGLPPGFTRLDPVALRLLNLPSSKCSFGDGQFCIPSLAGAPGLAANGQPRLATITRAGLGTFSDDQYVITLDKQLTQNNKITGRWFSSDNTLFQPFNNQSSLPFARTTPAVNRFLKIGMTSVITPRLVNEARAGFNRFTFKFAPEEPITLTDIGATRANSAEFPASYRFVVGGAGFSIGAGVNDDRGGAFNTFVLGDDVSYSFGQHTFRAGFEGSHYQLNRFNNFATRGVVNFNNTVAGLGGAGIPALIGMQNFLLGRVTSTQGQSGFATFYFRATDAAAYFQDDWRITPRLTLNLGLRWEGLSIAHEKQNFLSNFSANGDGSPGPIKVIHPEVTPRVGTPGVSNCTLLDCFDANNFAPRLGFAYDLFGDKKTVVRGGYGIYYMRTSNQALLQTSGGTPFSEPIAATPLSVTTVNPFPTIRPTSDFPLPNDQAIPQLIGFNSSTGAPIFSTVNGVTPAGSALQGSRFFPVRSFHAPYTQQFNMTVQRELFRNTVFEIGYVGTRGVDLIGPGNPLNPAQICTTASPCVIPAAIGSNVNVPAGTPGVVKNSDGSISITQSTAANANARVPANYLGLENNRMRAIDQRSQSVYHSLQTSLTRRFSNGVYYQVAYTWSKAIDNGSGSTFQDETNGLRPIGDLFDLRASRGLSDFDRTHRLVVSYNWELPFARWAGIEDRRWGKFINGWSLNGVTTFQSGTPFLIFDSTAPTLQDPNNVNTNNKALPIAGAPILTSGSVKDRLDSYVNLSAFTLGGACVNNQNAVVACTDPTSTGRRAEGLLGRNVFRGPFQQNWDLSLIKVTRVTEGKSVEFRAEFFNVWNHAAFQSPQAGNQTGLPFFGNYGLVDVSGGTSAILATANRPRTIQFALKLNF
jgi:carboxypeptidase family protein/TonB-dependent receptor-like protein